MKYLQCDLIKKINILNFETSVRRTSWLPEKYAKRGSYVKLKQDDGNWTDGWFVETVYVEVEFDEKTALIRSQDYKNQRKASDI